VLGQQQYNIFNPYQRVQAFQPGMPNNVPPANLRFLNTPVGANQTISDLMLPFNADINQGFQDYNIGFSPDFAPKFETGTIERAAEPQNVARNIEPYNYRPDDLYNYQPPQAGLGGVGALIGGWGGLEKAYDRVQDFDSLGDAVSTFGQSVGDAFGEAGDFFSTGMFGGGSPETLSGLPTTHFEDMAEQAYQASRGTLGVGGSEPEFIFDVGEGGAGQSHPYLAYLNIFLVFAFWPGPSASSLLQMTSPYHGPFILAFSGSVSSSQSSCSQPGAGMLSPSVALRLRGFVLGLPFCWFSSSREGSFTI